MRKGIMRYNGRRYAQMSGKRTAIISAKARKAIDGYYQRIRGGVFLYSRELELFAFVNLDGERYVVDARMEDGQTRFEKTASHETLDKLGFAACVFGEERDAINGIKFS